jgi:hypothetical protein
MSRDRRSAVYASGMLYPLKRGLVVSLNGACNLVDQVAYARPVIVVSRRLPRWWRCELGKAARRLDGRWATGYWSDGAGPTGELCVVCKRRATWLVRDRPGGARSPSAAGAPESTQARDGDITRRPSQAAPPS